MEGLADDLAALILSLIRCRAGAACGNREYPAIPTSDLYRTLHFAYGATTGEVTEAIRRACRTAEAELTGDGKRVRAGSTLTPVTEADRYAACDLSHRLYERLRESRVSLGVVDGVLPSIE